MPAFLWCVLAAAIARPAASWSPGGFPNQLGSAPPRGWRSWLAFQHQTDQAKMRAAIQSMTKARGETANQFSLLDLGYSDVALDGGWARCEGVNGSIHDEQGQLLINTTMFPSFAQMNKFAHKHGLTSSWYLNCDQCGDTQKLVQSEFTETWYAKDARKAAELEFDGVKFDTQPGGPNWNITKWAIAINATGRPLMIEDCLDKHPDGTPLPKSSHPKIDILDDPVQCPFNFYRTGPDNFPTFYHGMSNTLLSTEAFLNKTSPVRASRPGCWAYPDQLAIGKSAMQDMWIEKGCPRLSFVEEQTLFATWAIISSPLVLSFDITNDTEVDRLWPIIANKQALSINSQWAGEAGHVLKRSPEMQTMKDCGSPKSFIFPSYVVWAKRLSHPPGGLATLAINIGETMQSISITYEELTNSGAGAGTNPIELKGTNVWTGETEQYVLPKEHAAYHLGPHESRFVVWSPAKEPVAVSV